MLALSHLRQHVALDVGTATTRIATELSPLTERPTVLGNTHAVRDGVVVDETALSEILKPLLNRIRRFGILKPCVLTCAPTDARQEERQSLAHSIMMAGAASVSIIPEPLAAAVGAGLDVSSPYAQMVVDIGEGVTDCAIIRSGKVAFTCAKRVGCDRMRRAIISALNTRGDNRIDDSQADMLMQTYGLIGSHDDSEGQQTAKALRQVLEPVFERIDSFLRDLPDDVGCEVIESGICLTGGGAMIPGVRAYLAQCTGVSVTIARNPRASVVEGARTILPIIQVLNEWK